jgi:hypothetical protein|eukprot:scaffold2625_cov277-Chaetoceros_neogracile.AAC.7
MSSVECHHNIIMQIFCRKSANTSFTLTYPDRAAGMLRLTVTPLVSQQPVWPDKPIRPDDTISVAELQNRKFGVKKYNRPIFDLSFFIPGTSCKYLVWT